METLTQEDIVKITQEGEWLAKSLKRLEDCGFEYKDIPELTALFESLTKLEESRATQKDISPSTPKEAAALKAALDDEAYFSQAVKNLYAEATRKVKAEERRFVDEKSRVFAPHTDAINAADQEIKALLVPLFTALQDRYNAMKDLAGVQGYVEHLSFQQGRPHSQTEAPRWPRPFKQTPIRNFDEFGEAFAARMMRVLTINGHTPEARAERFYNKRDG